MKKLSDYRKYRILEMIPGTLIWLTFGGVIFISFFRPNWALYFIILLDLYWLIRVIYLLSYLLLAFKKMKSSIRVDWLKKCYELANWEDIHHLIFYPTYKEPIEVIRSSLTSLKNSNYPLNKFIVVLAGEERDQENFLRIAGSLENEFKDVFFKLLITCHPANIAGELAGKGANINYAGREAKKLIDELGLPYEKVVVSSFDVDTCAHREYFGYLTYHYLKHPKPTRTSFQPIPLYHNNIWEAPALMRVVANSTTFWLMTELLRPERLFTFSSHSMSFKALVDVGFWQNDIVTEDSRIFLQCFLEYDGDYSVSPMYIPVSMDTVLGKNLWQGLVNQYKQQRRWGWGIEHLPYMIWNFWDNKKISFKKKIYYFWNLSEGMYSWATVPILIFILGYLPLALASQELKSTPLAQNTPETLKFLMVVAMIGLLASAILSTILLPSKPQRFRILRFGFMVIQWVLFPLCMIIFGSIPATEAQTRLLLGKYLGFHVTEKARKGKD